MGVPSEPTVRGQSGSRAEVAPGREAPRDPAALPARRPRPRWLSLWPQGDEPCASLQVSDATALLCAAATAATGRAWPLGSPFDPSVLVPVDLGARSLGFPLSCG